MRIIILFVLSVFLFSCKKEKLEGESQVLVGTWRVKVIGGSSVTPEDPKYHEMEFQKKGIIKVFKGKDCIEKGRFLSIKLTGKNEITGQNNYSTECKTNTLFSKEDFISKIKLIELRFRNSYYNSSNYDLILITLEGHPTNTRFYERISY